MLYLSSHNLRPGYDHGGSPPTLRRTDRDPTDGLAPDYVMAERKLLVTLRLLMINVQVSAHTAKSEERMEF